MDQQQIPQTYSRVVFKNYDDQEAKEMVNSYKYQNVSPSRFKRWTPESQYEERYKKKREREDSYIQNFHQEDRPILVIKRKHEYKGTKNPAHFKDPSQNENYYKISENTQLVDDISKEIQEMENFIRRHTLIHKNPNVDTEGLNSVIKIEGQEFLPEGFIELDPILFKDEYEFESKEDERLFEQEQRKMKQLRRKQYEQRNEKKLRDVTIYVMDQKKSNIVEFLDKWNEKHQRKLNQGEIEYVAKVLDVDAEKLAYFQELFMKKKEIEKEAESKGQAIEQIPLRQQKEKYRQVPSKYLKQNTPYIPTFLSKYEKKTKNLPRYNIRKYSQNDGIDTKQLDRTLNKTLGTPEDDVEEYQNEPNLKLSESKKQFENNLEQYFDQEIHSILDKIKGQNKEQPHEKEFQKINNQSGKDQSFEIPVERSLSLSVKRSPNNPHLLDPGLNKYPKRFTMMAIGQNGEQFKIQKLNPIMIGNQYFFQSIETEFNQLMKKYKQTIYTRNDQGQLISEYQIPEEDMTSDYTNEVLDKPSSFIGEISKIVKIKNQRGEEVFTQVLTPTLPQLFLENEDDEILISNFKGAIIREVDNIKTHQLPPVLIHGNEFYQVIEEISFPEQNIEEINVLTYNNNKEIIHSHPVSRKLKGFQYYNVIQEEDTLLTKNNAGDIICSLQMNQFLENQNERIEEEDKLIMKLSPININDKVLRQEIHCQKNNILITLNQQNETLDAKEVNIDRNKNYYSEYQILDSEPQLLTKDDQGETVGVLKLSNEYLMQDQNKFDEIKNIQNEDGELRGSVMSKRRNTTTLRSYSIRPTLIGDKFYFQTINELIDDLDESKNKAILITQDEEGNTLDSQEIIPKYKTSEYYNQIVDQTIDNLGNRCSRLVTYNQDKVIIAETEVNSTIKNKFADGFYDQIVEELVNETNDEENVDILALSKLKNGTYDIVQDQIREQKQQEKMDFFRSLLKNHKKSETSQEKKRQDEEKLEKYKFMESDVIAFDAKLQDDVQDEINQALEDVQLIEKVDDQEKVDYIQQSLKQIHKKKSPSPQNYLQKNIQNLKEVNKKNKFNPEDAIELIKEKGFKEEPPKKLKKLKKKTQNKSLERTKPKGYAQIHAEKLPKEDDKNKSLIEEIYGNIDVEQAKESPQQNEYQNYDSVQNKLSRLDEAQIKQPIKSEEFRHPNNVLKQYYQEKFLTKDKLEDIEKVDDKENNHIKEEIDEVENDHIKDEIQDEVEDNINNEIDNQSENDQQDEQLQDSYEENVKEESFRDEMKENLREVVEQEKNKHPKIMEQMKQKLGIDSTDALVDDFYRFCQDLQNHSKYKESVLFATLFFYYMEKKKVKQFNNNEQYRK